MKKPLHLLVFFFLWIGAQAQTSISLPARFGIEGELKCNLYDRFISTGTDDWYPNMANPSTMGRGVIDTTGAVAAAATKQPFYRTMAAPQYSLINGKRWLDAVFIRDFNGQTNDETSFLTANKNGQSPGVWQGGPSPVPDKNDIADIMLHVRRDGDQIKSNLWLMGGIAVHGTTGNRYFDFELYQTDIFYSRSTGQFTNYGPNEGHTAWEFDASGKITKPGDVIFSGEYGSQKLDSLFARIWVRRSALSITPVDFDWGKRYDGGSNSSEFVYAEIIPKGGGTFYSGYTNGNANTNGQRWAGPFGYLDRTNTLRTDYVSGQFVEFAVDLTKLGLDPITLLGGDACGLPFRRILVKTRTSSSFTASLTDFIGPFDFFSTPPVQALADVPMYCGVMGVSNLSVMNPLPSSVYTWTTLDGNIFGDSVGSSIVVDTTGTYVVSQQLLDGCSSASTDTVTIYFDPTCTTLNISGLDFKGSISNGTARLNWTTTANDEFLYYHIERSVDGRNFQVVGQVQNKAPTAAKASYVYSDNISTLQSRTVYYRLNVKTSKGKSLYSNVVKMNKAAGTGDLLLYPNPANQYITISVFSAGRREAVVDIIDMSGKAVYHTFKSLQAGENIITIDKLTEWPSGVYLLRMTMGGESSWKRFVVNNSSLRN